MDWIGKSVSIKCDDKLGVFQGTIKNFSGSEITIIRAFRNGVPTRKHDTEITLRSSDIQSLDLIESCTVPSTIQSVVNNPTPVKVPNWDAMPTAMSASNFHRNVPVNVSIFQPDTESGCREQKSATSSSNVVANFFNKLMIPPKVEVKLGGSIMNGCHKKTNNIQETTDQVRGSSRPIDITVRSSSPSISKSLPNSNGFSFLRNGLTNGGNNGSSRKKKINGENKHHQTFGTPVDDAMMNEDFDFEGNLALFDKKAVWDDIESQQKPSEKSARPKSAGKPRQKTYRHTENILNNDLVGLRQIETDFNSGQEFVTDQGLVVPTIPHFVRAKVQKLGADNHLTMDRQNDMLARGTTELALIMLGGARRLIPNNIHQWPTVVIISDKNQCGDIAAATGRHLASHGLKVVLYFQDEDIHISNNKEVSLFKATGNDVVNSTEGLPSPDLVVLSTNSKNLTTNVKNWLTLGKRCLSILAIDPPASGFKDITLKCSIVPVLPLSNTTTATCGLVYLCNMGIPDKFYHDAGIKYKSPFGHKSVIQIHQRD